MLIAEFAVGQILALEEETGKAILQPTGTESRPQGGKFEV